MNVYVETNFILELAFMQEQYESCNKVLTLCEAGGSNLILPAFCIAESYATLIHQAKKREQLANNLARELRQLSRSVPYKNNVDVLQNATALLARSSQNEEQQLITVVDRGLKIADIISLEAEIIQAATQHRAKYSLVPRDSIVLASVLYHLSSAGNVESCFLNKNKRDFDDLDIRESLLNMHCKMLFNFDSGFNYIQK